MILASSDALPVYKLLRSFPRSLGTSILSQKGEGQHVLGVLAFGARHLVGRPGESPARRSEHYHEKTRCQIQSFGGVRRRRKIFS